MTVYVNATSSDDLFQNGTMLFLGNIALPSSEVKGQPVGSKFASHMQVSANQQLLNRDIKRQDVKDLGQMEGYFSNVKVQNLMCI